MTSRDVSDELLGQLSRKQHDLFRRVRDGSVPLNESLAGLQALIEQPYKYKRRGTITVPDLTESQLLKLAYTWLELIPPSHYRDLDPDLLGWDFLGDEREATFDVKVWTPGREPISTVEIRAFFTDGFKGNVAAFIAWITKYDPEGRFTSIPDDDRLFPRDGGLCAPCYVNGKKKRGLYLTDVVNPGFDDPSFSYVAFRKVA